MFLYRDFGINYRTNLLLKLVLFGTGSKIHVCNFYFMSKHLYLGIGNELIIFKYVSYEKILQSIKVTLNRGNDYLGFKNMEIIIEQIDYSNSLYVEEAMLRSMLYVSHTMREEGPII